MTDITEQLRDAARIHVELAGQSALATTINAGADEIDRLRGRVAELEAAKVEPVAWRGINDLGEVVTDWIDGPKPARLFDLCGNESGYASYQVAYTAPPAPRVDVDAISNAAIEHGCEAMWAHSYRIADQGSMRAALRAIFNKGE